MNIILLGAAGFIGKNLTIGLGRKPQNHLTLVDKSKHFFQEGNLYFPETTKIKEDAFDETTDFDKLLEGQDIVYHLVSTTASVTSNQHIEQELKANVIVTVNMLEACVRCKVKKVVFFSSGGTVYGKDVLCPINEEAPTNPICAYGLQKLSIEKLLFLYSYLHDLDYRVIRLSNPYRPYQRPNGGLGAITTFTYKALRGEEITVYGDGSVIRDFIYIEDAIKAIENIVEGESRHRIFNIGSGCGTSIRKVLEIIGVVLKTDLKVVYKSKRKADVPENYLDISRYETCFGKLNLVSLYEGIHRTAAFMKEQYHI